MIQTSDLQARGPVSKSHVRLPQRAEIPGKLTLRAKSSAFICLKKQKTGFEPVFISNQSEKLNTLPFFIFVYANANKPRRKGYFNCAVYWPLSIKAASPLSPYSGGLRVSQCLMKIRWGHLSAWCAPELIKLAYYAFNYVKSACMCSWRLILICDTPAHNNLTRARYSQGHPMRAKQRQVHVPRLSHFFVCFYTQTACVRDKGAAAVLCLWVNACFFTVHGHGFYRAFYIIFLSHTLAHFFQKQWSP